MKFLDKTTIHIIAEVIVLLGISIFLYRKIKTLTLYCAQLENRISRLQSKRSSPLPPPPPPRLVEHPVIEDIEHEDILDKEIEQEIEKIMEVS